MFSSGDLNLKRVIIDFISPQGEITCKYLEGGKKGDTICFYKKDLFGEVAYNEQSKHFTVGEIAVVENSNGTLVLYKIETDG